MGVSGWGHAPSGRRVSPAVEPMAWAQLPSGTGTAHGGSRSIPSCSLGLSSSRPSAGHILLLRALLLVCVPHHRSGCFRESPGPGSNCGQAQLHPRGLPVLGMSLALSQGSVLLRPQG